MNKKIDILRKYIEEELDDIENYFLELAITNNDYKKVYNATIEDLPPMMDTGNEFFNRLVCEKLKGDDITSPKYTFEAIWTLEFGIEGLEQIAYYDGRSSVLRDIAEKMGWKDLAKRANLCIYKD